jgi:hypothetical protein
VSVLWEHELDARVIEDAGWRRVGEQRFDDPAPSGGVALRRQTRACSRRRSARGFNSTRISLSRSARRCCSRASIC